MIEQDTIRLLRECDAGIQMGISSIDDVLRHATGKAFTRHLTACKDAHLQLQREIREQLARFRDEGKAPNPMARFMSRMKTTMKLCMHDTDSTIADLMTDGCNMGVKSLSKYLNQYKAADETSKDIAKRLIALEEQLAVDMRQYL